MNTALNMTREERDIWGRIACESETSLNQFLQECAMRGLRDYSPALADEIDRIRKARGMVVRIAKTAVTIVLISLMLVGGTQPRASRSIRVRGGRIEEALS